MQAIETKYLGPTNARGSRIKATCDRGSITIPYPHELSGDECHREAVRVLCAKFAQEDAADPKYPTPLAENPWMRPFVTGSVKHKYFHVFTK